MKKFFARNIPKIKGVCTPAVLRETISEVDAWYIKQRARTFKMKPNSRAP